MYDCDDYKLPSIEEIRAMKLLRETPRPFPWWSFFWWLVWINGFMWFLMYGQYKL